MNKQTQVIFWYYKTYFSEEYLLQAQEKLALQKIM